MTIETFNPEWAVTDPQNLHFITNKSDTDHLKDGYDILRLESNSWKAKEKNKDDMPQTQNHLPGLRATASSFNHAETFHARPREVIWNLYLKAVFELLWNTGSICWG
jgi:hypothetical protein